MITIKGGSHHHDTAAGVVRAERELNPALLGLLERALLLAEARPHTIRSASVAEGVVELHENTGTTVTVKLATGEVTR